MNAFLPISIGAGAASAILFLSTATGSLLAMMLLCLVVLPSFIAGLGWGNTAALVASATAAVLVGALLGPTAGLVYMAVLGAPVVILTYLALLAREAPADGSGQATVEWYPPGRIVAWATVMAGCVAALAIPALGFDAETYRQSARDYFNNAFFGPMAENAPENVDKEQFAPLVELFVTILPASSAMVWLGVMLTNLWAAEKILEVSGRAIRPAPQIIAINYPAQFSLGFFVSLAGTFLPGIPGILATGFTGAFLLAYILLGLAVCHVVARQYAFAGLLLSVLYLAMLFIGWVTLLVAIVGLSEPVFKLRERTNSKSNPPGNPGTGPN